MIVKHVHVCSFAVFCDILSRLCFWGMHFMEISERVLKFDLGPHDFHNVHPLQLKHGRRWAMFPDRGGGKRSAKMATGL